MPTFVRYVTLLTVLTLLLAGAFVATPAALPVAAAAALPVAPLLTADGVLRTDGLAAGALDLTGWDVSLDPARGPLFRPATQASTPGWYNLGQGSEGALDFLDAAYRYPCGAACVTSIAIDHAGRLYIGGAFNDAADIEAADHIVMWDPATQTWRALGSNSSGNGAIDEYFSDVQAIAINHDGKVFVGGSFENVAGIPAADCIAIWDPVTETWSALESNGQGYEQCGIKALAFDSEGQLYIGGDFTNWAGIQAADYLAMWKPDTQTWHALGSRNGEGVLNSSVQAIAIDRNDRVYVGGWFSDASGIAEADRVAMWDPESQTWSALGSHRNGGGALNYIVESLAIDHNGKVYVGGVFTDAAGIPEADGLAVWDPATNTWSALGSNGNGDGVFATGIDSVAAIAIDRTGRVYAGGSFRAPSISGANFLAVWEPATQTWHALGGDLSDWVLALALDHQDRLYIGGRFRNAASMRAADQIARWDPANRSWSALLRGRADGALNHVRDIVIDDYGRVYAGGWFTNAADLTEADYVAMWDPLSERWYGLGKDSNGNGVLNRGVNALVIDRRGRVYVGGNFTNAAGIPHADYLAVWDPIRQEWSAFSPPINGDGALNGAVWALAIDSRDRVYVGGGLTNAAGIPEADYVAVYDPATQQWSALGSNGHGNGAIAQGSDILGVYALAIDTRDRVYVGGNFLNVAGIAAADYVAMWDPADQAWHALGSNGSGDGAISANSEFNLVSTLAVTAHGHVYVGGDFANVAGLAATSDIAMYDSTTQTWHALVTDQGAGLISYGSTIDALLIDRNGKLYIGGDTIPYGVAIWDPATKIWDHVGDTMGFDPLDWYIWALALDKNDRLYAGGLFRDVADNRRADGIVAYGIPPSIFRTYIPAINR